MKICPSCGSELPDELSFCPQDGSPLLSEEEETGSPEEYSPVAGDIGEATIVMGEEEIETVVPDREDEGTVDEPQGEATLVMSELPDTGSTAGPTEEIPAVPDETMYSGGDLPEDAGAAGWTPASPEETADWTEGSEEWVEESTETPEEYASAVSQTDEWSSDEAAAAEPPELDHGAADVPQASQEPERSRSKLGLIIVLIIMFFTFLIIVAGAAGIFWYMSNRGADTALANANQDANQDANGIAESSPEETPFEEPLTNASDDANSSPEDGDAQANTERPTPSPGSTPDRKTPTPSRTPVKTPDTRPTAGRTPTPRPTSTPPRPTPTQEVPSRVSRGVVNGQAISLPKPVYPAAARAVNARGTVNVAVVISRSGQVISAKAVSGHPLLRAPAEAAARRARFRPTLLSGQPVEVSGSIVYNFQ